MGHNINEAPEKQSTGHNGSSAVLIILISVVVHEKLPGQKV